MCSLNTTALNLNPQPSTLKYHSYIVSQISAPTHPYQQLTQIPSSHLT